jgi:hypothetical protein
VWTKWDPNIIVRVGVTAGGVVDEVGLVFRHIPGEHLVRAWRAFRPRADHAQRIGGFVGAMGVENADRFELRLHSKADPVLEATFAPADAAFSRTQQLEVTNHPYVQSRIDLVEQLVKATSRRPRPRDIATLRSDR